MLIAHIQSKYGSENNKIIASLGEIVFYVIVMRDVPYQIYIHVGVGIYTVLIYVIY